MKKTININLAGYPFTIDEDAYNLLKDYLDTIRYAFDTKDDTGEIATDIEARIAEILLEKEGGNVRIVTIREISNVIERIGKPADFIEVDETSEIKEIKTEESDKEEKIEKEILEERETIVPPPYHSQGNYQTPLRKKLFRDPQNSILGGVCSGFAYYLDIDVTLVRVLFVLLFILSATTVGIAYVVLWIVVPEARTPLQRMQMMGKNPTVENIGKSVTENFREKEEKPSEETDSNKSSTARFFSSALSILLKCFMIIGLLIAFPLLIGLGAALFGCLIAVFVIGAVLIGAVSGMPSDMFDSTNEGLMVFYILLAVLGGIITIAVPVWLYVRKFMKKKDISYSNNNRRAIVIVWLGGIALLSIFTVKAVRKSYQIERMEKRIDKLELLNNVDFSEVEEMKISNGGVTIITNDGKRYKIGKGKVMVEYSDSTADARTNIDFSVEVDNDDIKGEISETVINSNDSVKILEKTVTSGDNAKSSEE